MPGPRRLHEAAIAIALGLACTRGAVAAEDSRYETLPRCPDDAAAALIAAPPPPRQRPAQEYEIDHGTFDLDEEGNLKVGGGVVLKQGDRELRTESLKMIGEGERFEVEGGLEYRDPELIVSGESGRLVGEEASFEGAQFELPLKPARGGADSLTANRDGKLRLEGVNYTTCPLGKDDWSIQADQVDLDTQRGTGTARDARIVVFGMPLVRLPVITFPVGNLRKSGLLFPSIGSSTSGGVELSIPYYFNLAPQQDFTFTPTWYSNRGIDLGGDYRYLARFGRGSLDGNLLPGDDQTGETRSRVKLTSLTELPGRWRLSVDAENVSDTRYLEDFARGTNDASIAFLPRQALLAYRDDHFDFGLMWRNFQTLDAELPQAERPHTELPRVFANGEWRQDDAGLPLLYGADLEAVNFLHSHDVQGWRVNATPHAALDFRGAGWFARPAVGFDATYYNLTDVAPGAPTSPSRTLPLVSLDTGLMFETLNGRNLQRRITLEPRLMYLYVPFEDQSDLPVFDTGEPDLNWVELFRANRFVGIDRLSDANQISAGVTTQLYSSGSGQRYISATLGQIYYLEKPRVLLPDEPPDTGHTSDLIAEIELSAFRNWNVNTGWQWDPQGQQTERAEVRLQYRPGPQQVMNFGYRYQRDRTEQAEYSVAWPISENWRLYGRTLYSLRDSKFIDNFAGFEYSSCCWALRAVARDYVGRRTGERERSIYLQLELKGLSNVGLAADAFLERSIRGYSSRRRR